jgi:hypothetical protein
VETAPEASGAAPVNSMSEDMTRTLMRAVLNVGASINKFDPMVSMYLTQLDLLEKFVVDIADSKPNRQTFSQLQAAMLDGGHHANTTA